MWPEGVLVCSMPEGSGVTSEPGACGCGSLKLCAALPPETASKRTSAAATGRRRAKRERLERNMDGFPICAVCHVEEHRARENCDIVCMRSRPSCEVSKPRGRHDPSTRPSIPQDKR